MMEVPEGLREGKGREVIIFLNGHKLLKFHEVHVSKKFKVQWTPSK